MKCETLIDDAKLTLSVFGSVVSISVDTQDDYAAQVLFEQLKEYMDNNKPITIWPATDT